MKILLSLVLYLALSCGAIAAGTDIAELRDGDMKKLNFHSTPQPVSTQTFETETGEDLSLEAFHGKVVLVNFWATWCAPCRKEMPSLSALQEALGGEAFEVVTIASGRNPLPAMEKFMSENGIDNLPLYRDPQLTLSREMKVLGLPITVILDPNGEEIARLTGDADWNSDSARAIISALIK